MAPETEIAATGTASSRGIAGRAGPAGGTSTPLRWRGALAVPAVAQFLIALDYSIIYIALPSIARDLALDPATAHWVISAYAVPFAGFLMAGGRLTDRLGPRRVFVAAITLFGVACLVGGFATGGGPLLAARGGQGFAAALLQPAVLGLIGTTFPAGPARGRALAVWSSVGASGLAAGAILGGLLTTSSWRLTFLVNVPLTLLCALAAARGGRRGPEAGDRVGREYVGGDVRAVPLLASVLGTVAALALVGGLTLGAEAGWGATPTIVTLAAALVASAAFVANEARSRRVLIDRVLRGTRSLRVGAVSATLYMASVGSEFYLVTLLLQEGKGYAPLVAGLAFLPLALMVTVGGVTAGRAARRMSPRAVLAAGFAVAAAGLGWLSLAVHGDSYATDLLPGLLLSGAGHGMIYTSMFIIGTGDVAAEHQGTAGALITTAQYLSAAFTVAVLTLVLGDGPGDGGFRAAFLITTAAAAAGVVLALLWKERPK